MLYKKNSPDGFVFSSISNNYVKDNVANTLKEAQESGKEFSDWETFLSSSIAYVDDKIVKEEILHKIETIKNLKEIPSNIFRPWEGTYNFNKVLSDAINQNRFRIQRTGDTLIDDVIKTIEVEISKPYPDRSKLQNEIARKTEIFVRPPSNPAEEALELLWGQFLQVYNRAIGIQHYCDTFDIGEILKNDDEIDLKVTSNLTQSALQALARESWTDFGERFNELSIYRNRWLKEVWELELEKKKTSYDASIALEEFIDQITLQYKLKPTFRDMIEVISGGASIDVDLMNSNSISFAISNQLLRVPIQTVDLIKRRLAYKKNKSNMIEYGQKFLPGI